MEISPFCRFCGNNLKNPFLDLGMSPLCESFRAYEQLNQKEAFYPLKVYFCEKCFLVQLEKYVSPKAIFSEYAYFSSYSESWLRHAQNYTDLVVDRFRLASDSLVIEIGSNDGYLLQYFVQKKIPVIGVDPAKNVARVAQEKGIQTVVGFFGSRLARRMKKEGKQADLLLGNNVLAQVPNINDFVAGMKALLKPNGIITLEVPHLMRLLERNQFDTIYHEHFSYFSVISLQRIFSKHRISIFDVEEIKTHGGSIRIYGKHYEDKSRTLSARVRDMADREIEAGLNREETYLDFHEKVKATKRDILSILIELKRQSKRIAGYGAPGKGNTLLNYCGIRQDFLDYTVDLNPYKHGKFTPGTHIEILPSEKIRVDRPDYVFIMPWNLKDEIIRQLSYIREWGGKFIVPIPHPKIISEF